MGTDIHLYVEYKKKKYNGEESKTWVSGDYLMYNPYYEADQEEDWEEEIVVKNLYGSRNYYLFDVLAGGRSGNDADAIFPARGIPEDSCGLIKKQKERWDGDGHTYSWLTLKEMKDHQKNSTIIKHQGWVSNDQKTLLDTTGESPIYYDDWETPNKVWAEWSEPDTTLNGIIKLLEERAYEIFNNGWGDYSEENDDKIRIVFWFDN